MFFFSGTILPRYVLFGGTVPPRYILFGGTVPQKSSSHYWENCALSLNCNLLDFEARYLIFWSLGPLLHFSSIVVQLACKSGSRADIQGGRIWPRNICRIYRVNIWNLDLTFSLFFGQPNMKNHSFFMSICHNGLKMIHRFLSWIPFFHILYDQILPLIFKGFFDFSF